MVHLETTLKKLPVLLVDCQATGPNPEKGQLLEIGWMEIRAIDLYEQEEVSFCPQSHLVRFPEGNALPARFSRITGILESDLEDALDARTVAGFLFQQVEKIRERNSSQSCPTVIHFARYEKAFLYDLCQRYGFDFKILDIVCTHEISRRLLSSLPRRGLRALAGYFGTSIPEARRTDHHLLATAQIWANLVIELEKQSKVNCLRELRTWLKECLPPKSNHREFLLDSQIRLNLPDCPGIYRMLRSNGDILYIGKATSLRKRVNSYFHNRGGMADHILEMLTQVNDLEITPVETPLEASLLESDEIKRHSPPYNKQLKANDRSLAYCSGDLAEIDSAPNPFCCLGPFPSSSLLRAISSLLKIAKNQDIQELDPFQVLGFPESMIPKPEILLEGIDQFRALRRKLFQAHLNWHLVKALGDQLWKERLDEQKVENDEEDGEDSIMEEFTWTPDRISSFCDSLILRIAHLSRKARWLCLLSESVISWSLGPPDDFFRRIVIANGEIAGAETIRPASLSATGPQFQKNRICRQQAIDLSTYDRLSVLTTEIRKLVSTGADVNIFVGLSKPIPKQRLAGILQWI